MKGEQYVYELSVTATKVLLLRVGRDREGGEEQRDNTASTVVQFKVYQDFY